MRRLYLRLLLKMLLYLIQLHFRNLGRRRSGYLLWWSKIYVSAFLSNIWRRWLTLLLILSHALLVRGWTLSLCWIISIIIGNGRLWRLLALNHLKELSSLRIIWTHCYCSGWNSTSSISSAHRNESFIFPFFLLREQRVFAHSDQVSLILALFIIDISRLLGVCTFSKLVVIRKVIA